jgi:integrase
VEVSRPVSQEVSLANRETEPPRKRIRNNRTRSCGLYLVRSGNTFLFQMKVPKTICSVRGKGPLRISLGSASAQDARATADRLAAVLRYWFRELGKRMSTENGLDGLGIQPDEDEDGESLLWKFLTTQMKAALFDIRDPAPPSSPQEAHDHAIVGNIVRISRELAASQEGGPHDALIADNAEVLAAAAASRLGQPPVERPASSTVLIPVADPPLQTVTKTVSAEVRPPAAVPSGKISKAEDFVPAFKQDRRSVARPASTKPLFSQVAREYLAARVSNTSKKNKDIGTARFRLNLFFDLIGDHPVDTYTIVDLHAYVDMLRCWPANLKDRDPNKTPRQIIDDNADLHLLPLSKKSMQDGYLPVVKAVVAHGGKLYDYKSQLAGAQLTYPETARPSIPSEPLAYHKMTKLLRTGVRTGYIDNAMLPLLGLLTGRRLGLLLHLKGSDIREKFEGVWVAQTEGVQLVDGSWTRIPMKTDASMTFFVLHNFLSEIGLVQWAVEHGDKFIFAELMRLADPSNSASSYKGRLFQRAKIKEARGEVFHSLRGAFIEEAANQDVERRDRKLQAGHQLGDDEHELYGFRALSEYKARKIANMQLNPEIDLSPYRGLNFAKMAAKKRDSGRPAQGS